MLAQIDNSIRFEFEVTRERSSLSRLKIFSIAFIFAFLVVLLQKAGIQPPRIQIGQASMPQVKKADVLKKILPKLTAKADMIHIQNDSLPLPVAYANANADAANSYEVVDLDTSTVVASKNPNSQYSIASLTKIMTAIVALDLANPNDEFKITNVAASEQPTKIGVVVGQEMSLDELLHAMLLTSANDAAEVVREGVDQKYHSQIFIDAMNQKAAFLGLKNSHFSNPQGFDSQQNYSSSSDLANLAAYAIANYPEIKDIVSQDYHFIPADQNHKQFDLYNWNGLLDVYPGIYGFKIGNTDHAGYTTVVASKRDNKNILVVLLGAPGVIERDLWASQLLDEAYQKIDNLTPVDVTKDTLLAKYSTWKYWN